MFDGTAQRLLAEENQPVEIFHFQGTEESFEVGIQIRTAWRQNHGLHAHACERRAEQGAELRVPVHEEIPLATEKTIFEMGEFAHGSSDLRCSGCAV